MHHHSYMYLILHSFSSLNLTEIKDGLVLTMFTDT